MLDSRSPKQRIPAVHTLLVALLIVLLPTVTPAAPPPATVTPAAPPVVRVPFICCHNTQFIVIPLRIGGGPPLPFLLDTGTSYALTLMPWAARRLGLYPTDQPVTFSKGVSASEHDGTTVKTGEAVLAGVGGQVKFDGVEAVVLDLPFLRVLPGHLAGIIGAPILSTAPVGIDFLSKQLTFFPPGTILAPPAGATVLPLAQMGPRYYVNASLVGGMAAAYLLDTGNSGVTVGRPLSDRWRSFGPKAQFLRPTVTADSDNVILTRSVLLPSLSIGGRTVHDVDVDVIPSRMTGLGMAVLARFRVTLDFPGRRLILEDAARAATGPSGRAGVTFRRTAGRFVVTSVIPGGRAARAGVRPGDQVVSVDGMSPADMAREVRIAGEADRSLDLFGQALTGGLSDAGHTLAIRRSDGTLRTVSFLQPSEADPSMFLPSGLRLERLGGQIMVAAVLCDSRGWRAGLRAGDALLTVNGRRVTPARLSSVEALMRRAPLHCLKLVVRPLDTRHQEFIVLTAVKGKSSLYSKPHL